MGLLKGVVEEVKLVHRYVCHCLCLLIGHVSLSYPSDQMSQWWQVPRIFLVGYHQALGPLYSWPSPVCIIIIITTITEIWKKPDKVLNHESQSLCNGRSKREREQSAWWEAFSTLQIQKGWERSWLGGWWRSYSGWWSWWDKNEDFWGKTPSSSSGLLLFDDIKKVGRRVLGQVITFGWWHDMIIK